MKTKNRANKNNKQKPETNLKNKKNKKLKFSKRHPVISISIKIFFLLFLALIVVAAGIVVGILYGNWGEEFEINKEELVIRGNSVVYDSEGNVRAELSGDENRKIIKLDDMAKHLPEAYIAIEDERFESHNGVDFKRTGGAIGSFILHKGSSNYGGSTITQQLVKNMTDDKDRSGLAGVTRKVKEWAKALQIERMLSKKQILELYLNVIFVGDVNYGVEVGAEYYFNKSAKDLNLAECAFMAGINNAPNSYNPYGQYSYKKDDNKKQKINKRTKTVLMKMLELGYITQEEHDKACEQVDKGLKFKKGNQDSKIYSYHIDATISKVINDFIAEKGWTKEYATTYVYGGGLKIYSTEKPEVQEKIEKIMEDNASTYQRNSRKNKGEKSQAAMTVIDNETGYVVGIVGGLGKKNTSRGLNRATQSPRSTGSSIKPIADLLPGLQEKLITPSTMYADVQTAFENGKYKPKNDYSNYYGDMDLRTAIAKSHNIPFVKIMAEVTNPVATSYLKKMGITTLSEKNDVGLSVAIGGLTNGITTLEMAGAYATIANDGVYRTPLLYTKVVNSDGKVELEPKQETRDVCSKQTAYLIKNMLTSVVKGGGTAPYCAISGMDVAAKTGTTNADKDRWLCGFTNYYTGATWYGFDDPEEVKYTGNPAGQIWAATMKSLHKDKKNSKFKEPKGIVSVKVCNHTGLKATSKCKSTRYEIFAEGNIPEECDESGNSVEVCEESGKLATEFCPKKKTEFGSYILPKEKLGLWENLSGSKGSKRLPTKMCDIHNENSAKENAEAPKITLIGNTSITLNVGESYIEKGAKAKDKTDGDLTSNIQISGSVNTSRAGTYTIKYKVKNSLGKETTATRTIIVKDKSTPAPTPAPKPDSGNTSATNTTGGNTNTSGGGSGTSNSTSGGETGNTNSSSNTSTTTEP